MISINIVDRKLQQVALAIVSTCLARIYRCSEYVYSLCAHLATAWRIHSDICVCMLHCSGDREKERSEKAEHRKKIEHTESTSVYGREEENAKTHFHSLCFFSVLIVHLRLGGSTDVLCYIIVNNVTDNAFMWAASGVRMELNAIEWATTTKTQHAQRDQPNNNNNANNKKKWRRKEYLWLLLRLCATHENSSVGVSSALVININIVSNEHVKESPVSFVMFVYFLFVDIYPCNVFFPDCSAVCWSFLPCFFFFLLLISFFSSYRIRPTILVGLMSFGALCFVILPDLWQNVRQCCSLTLSTRANQANFDGEICFSFILIEADERLIQEGKEESWVGIERTARQTAHT